jgi:FMN-dependent NADH-azoreductase
MKTKTREKLQMKITTILGSPRKKGNTAAVLERFEELVTPQNEIRRINLSEYELKGCLGCNACQMNSTAPGCVQKDNIAAIINQILDSDLVVYATPLYGWNFTAQMKTLLDRHYCLIKWSADGGHSSLAKGIHAALLVTCAGPVENNADLIQQAFDRQVEYLQFVNSGKYIVPYFSTPEQAEERLDKTAQSLAETVQSRANAFIDEIGIASKDPL